MQLIGLGLVVAALIGLVVVLLINGPAKGSAADLARRAFRSATGSSRQR